MSTDERPRPDSGVAMILVIVWSASLMVLTLIVSQSIINAIRPSELNETSFQALAAAEAGVEDYRARLALVGTVSQVQSPALAGWVRIPGTATDAYFTYRLVADASSARAGEVRLRSTGLVNGVTRTIDAVLRKRTTYDYGYMSGNESVPWDFPDAYTGGGGELSPAQAQAFCSGLWYEPALMATSSTALGPHRNSRACKYISVKSTDRWHGDMHTNDVWYFGDNLGSVFDGAITTSCPPGNGTNGCPTNQRWISPAVVTPANAANLSNYLQNEIPTVTLRAWNPEYAPPLELPPAPTALVARAQEAGCYFRGPTRIRWHEGGVIVVTSPDTRDADINAFCREAGRSYYATNATNQPTHVLNYDAMVAAGFNGILYIDAATEQNPPSCQVKSTGSIYPFVIPSTATYSERITYAFPPSEDLITSGSPFGFPVAATTSSDPWSSGGCARGTAYIQGAYRGQLTIASSYDISITGQLWDENLRNANWTQPTLTSYGVPPATSLNTLGVIPQRYLYVYLPRTEQGGGGNQWRATNLNNLAINAAALVLNGCFAVQDWTTTVQRGVLKFVGSLAQANRCSIEKPSGNGGYNPFVVYYDDRLARSVAPPSMADLFTEPWRLDQVAEVPATAVTDLPALP